MAIDRSKLAHAVRQVADDEDTQKEIREFIVALASVYAAARRVGRWGLADPEVRDRLNLAIERGGSAKTRLQRRSHRLRRVLLVGGLAATSAGIVVWRSLASGDDPANGQ